ncbi:hypothetical protein [Marinobacterium sp. LSUCC0821]|uniref:hypothetical protein n=1 Tax=Marinobacterium sp. LSUCC0821 TaxID=2668067 RepID=UPI0014517BFA|nr:hypothetical protein [Marinobacterium sp. LSUCC0821]QJD71062.1 hypothetical protein HH196_04855 [Marinobacterium sp. LSUCC0821]
MNSFFHQLRHLVLFIATFLPLSVSAADLLLWPIDARETPAKAVGAEAKWVQFLIEKGRAEQVPVALPSDYGVGPLFYPQLIAGADESSILAKSAAGTGAGSALSIRLNSDGINWMLVNGSSVQTLRTSVTSDGLSLGVSWIKMQLAIETVVAPNGPIVEDLNAPQSITTEAAAPAQAPTPAQTTSVAASEVTSLPAISELKVQDVTAKPISETPVIDTPIIDRPVLSVQKPEAEALTKQTQVSNSAYKPAGLEIAVSDVNTLSDLMRLSDQLRTEPGIDYLFVSRLLGNQVQFVIGSKLSVADISSRLIDRPWLEATGIDTFRYVTVQTVEEATNLEDLLALPIEEAAVVAEASDLPSSDITQMDGLSIQTVPAVQE